MNNFIKQLLCNHDKKIHENTLNKDLFIVSRYRCLNCNKIISKQIIGKVD